jgi:hypothetical protein
LVVAAVEVADGHDLLDPGPDALGLDRRRPGESEAEDEGEDEENGDSP